MNFAATALGAGIVAAVIIAHLQGALAPTSDSITGATVIDARLDPMTTASIAPATVDTTRPTAIRLIDLRSGVTCRMAPPERADRHFAPAPIGPDCAGSPDLRNVALWRSDGDGSLELADGDGQTLLRFMPGDGVLYESIYPSEAMVTIVRARG
ncbi:hypothetical protein VQ042_03500 [Aurantimonas sp. A2-1-M11]|uniref:hypothetical protein n=1 Tax=Aurantimonas sp. A2-1-M11 TaxID=3113712 RepID=UPI002F92FB4E